MNYIDFLKKLDDNKLKNINLIKVVEPYLYDKMKNILKRDFIGEEFLDFNFERFDFEKMTREEFESSIETLPFMSDRKIILIENMILDKDKLKKYEDILEFMSKKFLDLSEYSYVFLICSTEKLFKGKFVKLIEKNGDIIELQRLDRNQLNGFVSKFFLNSDKKISPKSIGLINTRLGYLDRDSKINLFDVENELKKLIHNIKSTSPTDEEIEDAITQNFDEKIFSLLDAMVDRNVKKALIIYKRMQEEDQFMIFYMIVRQIRNMICLRDIYEKKISKETGLKYTGLSYFEYDKLMSRIKFFDLQKLLRLHSMCYELEKGIKTSSASIGFGIEKLIIGFM